jgi:hypothetical protein
VAIDAALIRLRLKAIDYLSPEITNQIPDSNSVSAVQIFHTHGFLLERGDLILRDSRRNFRMSFSQTTVLSHSFLAYLQPALLYNNPVLFASIFSIVL